MEITLGQIYASFNLLNRIVDQQLPITLAFRFTRLIRELNKEYTSLNSLRDGLVRKFGEEVEGQPGGFRVTDENREAFLEEFQELLQEKVEIEWELISIEAPGLDSLQLSVRELSVLGWIFTEFKELADEAAEEVAAAAVEEDLEEGEEAPEAEAEAPVEAEVG